MFFMVMKKKNLIFISAILIFLIIASVTYSILQAQAIGLKHTAKNNSEYLITIYIEEKKLYLFESNKLIKEYPIATGKPGWQSPIGQWKIVYKSTWGEGFGGRWMGLNVPWGKYGIHGTTKESSIGYAASHGCIRMYNKDVKELYNKVPIGTPVIIKSGAFGAFGTGFRVLKPGDRGSDVFAVQQRLKELGYFKGRISGIYKDDLKNALFKFQEDMKLRVKHNITYSDYRAMGFMEFE